MAKKIDLSGMKEFFFHHGEKVALGACAFIALVLGFWGLFDALGAGKPAGMSESFSQVFMKRAQEIRRQIDVAQIPKLEPFNPALCIWGPVDSKHVSTPYAALNEQGGDKRRNPQVVKIRNDPGTIQVDYIRGLVYAHETGMNTGNARVLMGFDPDGAAVAPPAPKKGAPPVVLPQKWVHAARAKRMIVVQAIFPMKQQVEEFRQAFKMSDQSDMFKKDRDDLPRPLGIDVFRHEVPAKGQPAKDPELLMLFDRERLQMMPTLETFLREAIYDENSPVALEDYLFFGLATPMPKLANRTYPRFDFRKFGLDVDWAFLDEVEKNQMVAGGPAPPQPPAKQGVGFKLPGKKAPPPPPPPDPQKKLAGEPRGVPEKDLKLALPSLANRLWGKNIDEDFKIFHVLGNLPPDGNAPRAVPNGKPSDTDRYFSAWDKNPPEAAAKDGPPDPKAKQAPPVATAFPAWDRDALVRFIDVDVVPGKTYYYSIRVRMANPNFNKKDKVAFADLASSPELPPSGWVDTPQMKIPDEYHLYAIDQQTHDDWADGKGGIPKGPAPILTPTAANFINNYTAFQVHQWTEKARDMRADLQSFVVGDWIVAERQFVRKGDYIGKDVDPPRIGDQLFPPLGVIVQVPVWNKDKDTFELPQSRRDPKKEKFFPKGIHVNLTLKDDRAPVLVDFTGGKRLAKNNALEEETAVDALVLMPDGKLKVLNSRVAADTVGNPDEKARQEANERQERVLDARRTVERILNANSGATPKVGPKLPGPKGGG